MNHFSKNCIDENSFSYFSVVKRQEDTCLDVSVVFMVYQDLAPDQELLLLLLRMGDLGIEVLQAEIIHTTENIKYHPI